MNTLNKNIFANYIGKIWGFASIFIFIRLYIEILGIQSYAIISFYSIILGLLAFADSGLTATLNRELAKENSKKDKADLLFTFERIYFVICILVILGVIVFSDIISENFLKSDEYPPSEISYFVKFIGIGVGIQLFSTLYEGGLMGLQKQVLTNKIKILWSLFRSGIVIIPLYFLPRLDIYFFWQILCNVVLLYFMRMYLWRELGLRSTSHFSVTMLKNVWRYALGMMGIAFISAINIQIDKLVTSKLLDLKLFGIYSLGTTIAQIPFLIVSPIIIAVFPLLTNAVSQNNIEIKKEYFHKFSFLITIIASPIVASIFIYTYPIVVFWTGDIEIANTINATVKILIIGGFFLCLQLTPFYVALANGHTKINIVTGIVGLIVIIPLIFYCVTEYGMIGASFPWLLINFLAFIILGIYILNKFLPNQLRKWFVQDVIFPTLVTILVSALVYFSMSLLNFKYLFFIEMGLITCLSLLLNIIIYNYLNPEKKLIDVKVILHKLKTHE